MYFVHNPFVAAANLNKCLASGTEIVANGNFKGHVSSGNHFMFRLESAETWEGPWEVVSGWNIISTQADKPTQMEAWFKSDGSLHVIYLDRFFNPSTPDKRSLSISSLGGDELCSLQTKEKELVVIEGKNASALPNRVLVKDNQGLESLSSARPEPSLDGCKTFFGEIHWHSEFSGDGHRPIRDCMESARDHLVLDFACPGDHGVFMMGYTFDAFYDVMDEFNDPGTFATMLGFELSFGQGHVNFYFRDRKAAAKFDDAWQEFTSKPRHESPERLWLDPFYKHLSPDEMLVIPHHTNDTSRGVVNKQGITGWRNFDWRAVNNDYTRIVELVQQRGNFECEELDEDWGIISGGFGSSIRSALAKDLRFGFIGGTDNHAGWPVRSAKGKGYCGLTAVQAAELTRESLWEAFRARRTYATSGARIFLDFTLNDRYPMGSEAKLRPIEKRVFAIKIRGTAPIERVEIIHQGATLASLSVNCSTDADLTWAEPRPEAPLDNCCYYLRVRQTDGHRAWSSPIWVDYQEWA